MKPVSELWSRIRKEKAEDPSFNRWRKSMWAAAGGVALLGVGAVLHVVGVGDFEKIPEIAGGVLLLGGLAVAGNNEEWTASNNRAIEAAPIDPLSR